MTTPRAATCSALGALHTPRARRARQTARRASRRRAHLAPAAGRGRIGGEDEATVAAIRDVEALLDEALRVWKPTLGSRK
jgi:hypothetical protein